MRLQRFFLAMLAVASLTACSSDDVTAPASTTAPSIRRSAQEDEDGPERWHDTMMLPMATTQFVPCANGGRGEQVYLEGVLMIVSSQFEDGSNAVHYRTSEQLQGFAGYGLTTGQAYRASGGFSVHEYTDVDREDYWLGTTFEWTDRMQIVGGGVVAQLHVKRRETIDPAGGGWVPEVIIERVECR
jgi:hypothetical protein